MSADAAPITPAAFAAAIEDLPLSTLHLKAAELRNSLAHLEYSNAQLEPFAYPSPLSNEQPDAVCVEAIEENIGVMTRYRERLELLKAEAEKRGVGFGELLGGERIEDLPERQPGVNGSLPEAEAASLRARQNEGGRVAEERERETEIRESVQRGQEQSARHSAWTDGTFQMGTIRDGEILMDEPPAAPTAQQANGVRNEEIQPEQQEEEEEVTSIAQMSSAARTNGTSTTQHGQQGGRLSDEEISRRMDALIDADDEDGIHL